MSLKECPACGGNGEVFVGSHAFPRFGVLAMKAECQVCGGVGHTKPKTKLRKRGTSCINHNLRPIVTDPTAKCVLELDVQTAV